MKDFKPLSRLLLRLLICLPFSVLGDVMDEEEESLTPTPAAREVFNLYRQPVSPEPTTSQKILSCHDLEREIARLHPLTYSYQPSFYQDGYHGTTIFVATTVFPPTYVLNGYFSYLGAKEQGRIISTENKIELLRHLKAQQHCFES